jgi:hypothetical protein
VGERGGLRSATQRSPLRRQGGLGEGDGREDDREAKERRWQPAAAWIVK